MRLAAALFLLAAASGAADARAEERPLTRPTRDVDVTYTATVGGKPMRQRTRTVAGAVAVRIDTPSPGLYMIVDRRAHTMDMVSDGDRGVVQLPFDPLRAGSVGPDDAAYRRLGVDRVAGLVCTEWATTDTAGREVAACFTEDGVLLRARTGASVLVQAASVAYGKLDPALFAVPADYARTTPPRR